MKSKLFVLFIISAFVISLIPASAFAAAPQELTVFVRNTTGGVVDLKLTDADGGIHWLTLDAGVFETTLVEGVYEYYAVTPCGTQSGYWNLNVSKQLDIHCKDGILDLSLSKRCDGNMWGTVYHFPLQVRIGSAGYQSANGFISPFYFVMGDVTNIGDVILLPPGWYLIQGETMCWSDWLSLVNGNTGYMFDGIWGTFFN